MAVKAVAVGSGGAESGPSWYGSQGEVACVEVCPVMSRQFSLGTAWYDEDWCGSHGTSRYDDACYVGARYGIFCQFNF